MTNKILIITGGSRGIGEKVILTFLENGWKVINISRTPCQIKSVINFSLDLSSSKNIENDSEKLRYLLDKNSIISLVHNAGFYKKDSISTILIDDLQTTLEVNVISPILLNQIFLPRMLTGSSILYIGSTLAEIAVPNSASYVISKHAVKGLMKSTCQDLAGRGVQTCCINPGLVNTVLLKDTMSQDKIDALVNTKIMDKRLIEPEEIAKIIYFCTTTPTLNGSTIDANLGQINN